jgi:hypothetical protein
MRWRRCDGLDVGDGQQLFGLLAGQPVPQSSPLLADVGDVGQARGLLLSDHVGAPGLTHQLGLLALAAFGRLARTNKTGV